MEAEEAWALLKACPLYRHDPEDSPHHYIIMSDVWAWALGDAIKLTDENVVRVAELYDRYGFCGLLYHEIERGRYTCSEFTDYNRMIQFVENEERIRREVTDLNRRGYHKAEYTITGEIEHLREKDEEIARLRAKLEQAEALVKEGEKG